MAFETFAATEIRRQVAWQDNAPRQFHYRDRDGREVDVVLERRDGSVVAVEVKAAASASPADFRGLRHLRDKLGDRFKAGVLLTPGRAPCRSATGWPRSRSADCGPRDVVIRTSIRRNPLPSSLPYLGDLTAPERARAHETWGLQAQRNPVASFRAQYRPFRGNPIGHVRTGQEYAQGLAGTAVWAADPCPNPAEVCLPEFEQESRTRNNGGRFLRTPTSPQDRGRFAVGSDGAAKRLLSA